MHNKLVFYLIWIGLLLSACTLPAPPPPMDGIEITLSPTQGLVTTHPAVEELTPTITQTQEPGPTDTPTLDVQPTLTPVNTPDDDNPEIGETEPEVVYRYETQQGTPIGTINFVRPEAGCEWMGVGGQVFGQDSKPVNGLIVEVEGLLDGESLLTLSLTGDEPILGPGGYVVQLANQPVATQGTLWLQLFDMDGNALSPEVPFDTFGGELSCEKNLTIINFSELSVGFGYDYNMPLIFNNSSSYRGKQ